MRDRRTAVGDVDAHLDDATDLGVVHAAEGRRHHQIGSGGGDLAGELDRMVEVHQVEQPFDHRLTGVGAGRTDHTEHRRPARADEGVGHGETERLDRGGGGEIRRQGVAGDRGMVGDRVRVPGESRGAHARLDIGQAATGGDGQDRGHRRRRVVGADQRVATVGDRLGGMQRDADGGAGDGHDEIEAATSRAFQDGPGRCVFSTVGVDDHPAATIADHGGRVGHDTSGPLDVVGLQDRGDGALAGDDPSTLAAVDRDRLATGRGQLGGHLSLKSVEQFPDGLVDAGDTRDGDGAGDDAHLVGRVAGVVGLPQRIATPPAAHVLVDDGHEVDGLAGGAAQLEEEGDVGRVQDVGLGGRVHADQYIERGMWVVGARHRAEHGGHLAAVGRSHPGLGALEHVGEPGLPGDVGPRQLVGAAVPHREGGVALEPLPVGHPGDIAEVGLGRVRESLDDLLATVGDGIGIAGDVVEQASAAGRGVVDLVDVGAELAAPGGHARGGVSGADPFVAADGVDEQLLDLGGGGGLLGGHRGGADEDAVERHLGIAQVLRPHAGQVFGGPLGCADATADADHHVRAGAQLAVGGQQQVVEVLPRMVPAGAATLDLHNDRMIRDLGGDPHDGADLLDGARLERDIPQTRLDELVDERDGVVEFGDAGGHDHTVERCALRACLLHDAFAAELQLPQVRVEEQCVELRLAARLQQIGECGDVVGEDLLGDLTATGELGPVPGVGGCGHDRGVDGRGCHTGEQHR